MSYQLQIYLVLVKVKQVAVFACSFVWIGSLEEHLLQVVPIPMERLSRDAKLMRVHPTEPEIRYHVRLDNFFFLSMRIKNGTKIYKCTQSVLQIINTRIEMENNQIEDIISGSKKSFF